MKKVLFVTAVAILLAAPFSYACAGGRQALLVYRLYDEQQQISAILSASDFQVTSVSDADYHTEMLDGFTFLVSTDPIACLDGLHRGMKVLCIGPDTLTAGKLKITTASGVGGALLLGQLRSPFFYSDQVYLIQGVDSGAAVGEMKIPLRGSFPYGVIVDNTAFVPNFSKDALQPFALSQVIYKLFDDNQSGRLFLWIDEVYPFSDMGMLCMMADALYERGYPFTVAAMPVYDNLEYPAYLRYTQVLRYIQSRGGAVVLHDPLIRTAEKELESADERLTRARDALAKQGIILANGIVSPYPLTLTDLDALVLDSKTALGSLPMDVAVTLPIFKTPEEMNQALTLLKDKWVAAASLYKMAADSPYVYNEEPIAQDYSYRAKVETSFDRFFSAGNQTLIVIVLISLFVFSIMLAGGYFLYRRKFYR